MNSTDDKTFQTINFTLSPLPKGEYENCRFINCDLSDNNFSEMKFIDCEFTGCNLSLVKLGMTIFRDVNFKDCKMLGLRFDHCSEYGLAFNLDNCTLDHSSFYQAKIKKTVFKDCQLHEVDLTECDATAAVFENCDFKNATFENTILEKADLRHSYDYSIDPAENKIRKAIFSLSSIAGLLNRYGIEIDSKS